MCLSQYAGYFTHMYVAMPLCLQHAYRVPLSEETEEYCSGSIGNQSAASSLASKEIVSSDDRPQEKACL